MNLMNPRRAALVLAFAGTAYAQQPPGFRSSVDLVQVDVTVDTGDRA